MCHEIWRVPRLRGSRVAEHRPSEFAALPWQTNGSTVLLEEKQHACRKHLDLLLRVERPFRHGWWRSVWWKRYSEGQGRKPYRENFDQDGNFVIISPVGGGAAEYGFKPLEKRRGGSAKRFKYFMPVGSINREASDGRFLPTRPLQVLRCRLSGMREHIVWGFFMHDTVMVWGNTFANCETSIFHCSSITWLFVLESFWNVVSNSLVCLDPSLHLLRI